MSEAPDDYSEKEPVVLPVELEQLIIEMVAQDILFPLTRRGTFRFCLDLQLTARRFREWILPFVYRVLHIRAFSFQLRLGKAHLLEKLMNYGGRTTHLLFQQSAFGEDNGEMLASLLNCCPNLVDLAIWHWPPMESTNESVPPRTAGCLSKLKRLSTSSTVIRSSMMLPDGYLNITHLDIFGPSDWKLLTRFRNLSHLCINNSPVTRSLIDCISEKDATSRPIRVVVAIDGRYVAWNDIRYVYLLPAREDTDVEADWFNGANGGMDFWEFAERIVICREKGYLSPDSFPLEIQRVRFEAEVRAGKELTEAGQSWWSERDRDMLAIVEDDEQDYGNNSLVYQGIRFGDV